MRFRAEQHLRRQSDFRDAREKGRRQDCGAFTLWWYRRPSVVAAESSSAPSHVDPAVPAIHIQGPRVGVIASTAAVGKAVKRNRAKRRMRAIFCQHQNLVPADCDLLMIARNALNQLEYRQLEQKFVEACRKTFPSVS
jgi:ribonuclease P protein component